MLPVPVAPIVYFGRHDVGPPGPGGAEGLGIVGAAPGVIAPAEVRISRTSARDSSVKVRDVPPPAVLPALHFLSPGARR